MKLLRILLALLVVCVMSFVLMTQNFDFMPYPMTILGVLMFVIGIDDFRKGKKDYYILNIGVGVFIILVSLLRFLYH